MDKELQLLALAHQEYPAETVAFASELLAKIPLPFAAGLWVDDTQGRGLLHRQCFALLNNDRVARGLPRRNWVKFSTQWPENESCNACKKRGILHP